jgi:hypothetical protein
MPTLISFLAFVFIVLPSQGLYSVTDKPDAVTFYTLAYGYGGTIPLLAHEDLAGAAFMQLRTGDTITLDNSKRFTVTEILRYKASAPSSVWSGFVGEDGQGINSEELGHLIYVSGHALVLQTCTDNGAGRLFVIAEPVVVERKAEAR